MLFYAFTIFLSAFLLFQVQPIIAKMILPWFGGSAAVWNTCMLFFQAALLGGYLYAHWSIRTLRPKTQVWLHAALLAASLALLPVTPAASWKPQDAAHPIARILGLLAASVGLPYFLLSTTTPLIQAWYTRAGRGAVPYRLFALSNLGSMLALLGYPPLVEPFLSTRMQGAVWSVLYAAFAALCVYTAIRSLQSGAADFGPQPVENVQAAEDPAPPPGWGPHVLWTLLAAGPSLLLLAVTNHLTQDVASFPFLWIVPLALYLLTFILCFDARGWYQRRVFYPLLFTGLGGMAYLIGGDTEDIRITAAVFAGGFFAAGMVCHGELARLKPHPRHLTSFYLMLSIGGVCGGLFVALVAPTLFPTFIELPVAMALCGSLAVYVLAADPESDLYRDWLNPVLALMAACVLAVSIYLGRVVLAQTQNHKVVARNFYGSLRVREHDPKEWDGYVTLLHGAINHGEQWTHPDRRREPLTYYCRDSGVGKALLWLDPARPRRVGLLGLGAGTLATYGRPGDYFRFYEINPLVLELARKHFYYLAESRARVEVALGDARLSLEREPEQHFDLLAVDVFSGDSIPVHLLTREAFALYFRHLKPDGMLAVHVSNKHLDLPPVVERAAREFRKAAWMIDTDEDDEGSCFGSTWVLLASDGKVFEQQIFRGGEPAPSRPGLPIWTDDYSNLYRILK